MIVASIALLVKLKFTFCVHKNYMYCKYVVVHVRVIPVAQLQHNAM